MFRCFLTTLLVLSTCGNVGLAAPFFKRANKPEPAEYVPALIKTLQTDPDERKREVAAEELREYDLKSFPDIMPALVEALKNDPSSSVRLEVVSTISKLRPITQQAGYALEQAVASDNSFRVRASAKASLVQWVAFNGYRQSRTADTVPNQTEEPPLAAPATGTAPLPKSPILSAPKDKVEPMLPPPPLMPSPSVTKPSSSRSLFPLFSRSNKPDSKASDDGPTLNPPK